METYHDETRVVSVPPAEGGDADLWDLPRMQHFASAVCVSTENQTGAKPPHQLEHRMAKRKKLDEKEIGLRTMFS